jgi:hypothetical protein
MQEKSYVHLYRINIDHAGRSAYERVPGHKKGLRNYIIDGREVLLEEWFDAWMDRWLYTQVDRIEKAGRQTD